MKIYLQVEENKSQLIEKKLSTVTEENEVTKNVNGVKVNKQNKNVEAGNETNIKIFLEQITIEQDSKEDASKDKQINEKPIVREINKFEHKSRKCNLGGGKVVIIKDKKYEFQKAQGDGNCLLRSVSIFLYGHEEYDKLLRSEIVGNTEENWN